MLCNPFITFKALFRTLVEHLLCTEERAALSSSALWIPGKKYEFLRYLPCGGADISVKNLHVFRASCSLQVA